MNQQRLMISETGTQTASEASTLSVSVAAAPSPATTATAGTPVMPAAETAPAAAPAPTHELVLPSTGVTLADVERSFIEQALVRTAGNQTRAARLLGLSRYALRYRMQKHGIAAHFAPPRQPPPSRVSARRGKRAAGVSS